LLEDIRVFCQSVGAKDDECTFQAREVIISAGAVAEIILDSAREYECDVIVLASREGVLSGNHLSDTIKKVLKEASIPVLVVPSRVDS